MVTDFTKPLERNKANNTDLETNDCIFRGKKYYLMKKEKGNALALMVFRMLT